MKKQLYPKTERIWEEQVVITEKLDWSNLWIFKLNWEIYFAQRNNIFKYTELNKTNAYKWLKGWADVNQEELFKLNEKSCIFWEWIWMWKIWYWDSLPERFYMFAKANITEDFEVIRLNYNHDLFIYPFENQEIPECIWVVPIIEKTSKVPTIQELDDLYKDYSNRVNEWWVEGFVVNYPWGIKKYVRMKNWRLSEHRT